jgi:hypothetical protein
MTTVDDDRNHHTMTTTEQRPAARPERFRDELIQPFLIVAVVAGTIVQWPASQILFPLVALPLFVLVSIAAVGTLFPSTRLSKRGRGR